MSLLIAFGRFWYDFVIGDDPKIAVAVALSLAVLLVFVTGDVFGDGGLAILGGSLIVVSFAISLAIDVRLKQR